MSSIIGIIPARYLSTRFPGKPLANIAGKSMICRVYDQAIKAKLLNDVYVATDDKRIYDEVLRIGGKAVMTAPNLVNGTERCFDAYRQISETGGPSDYLLNIQGDEPFIRPEQINELCRVIAISGTPVATMVRKIQREDELWDENTVKVALDKHGNAMYFSRSPIPYLRGVERNKWLLRAEFYKHVGIYAFRTSAIAQILALHPTPLEKAENLEQLRWLEHGLDIRTGISEWDSLSVDTPHDLEKAIAFAGRPENGK